MTRCWSSRSPTSTMSAAARVGGSITAALFMRRFVTAAKAWLHFDLFAWTATARPGPAGRRRLPGGARALCAARRALRLSGMNARPSILASRRHGPISRRSISKARCRRRGSSKGASTRVIEPQAPLRREPRPDAPLETEALKGERVTVYDANGEGWAWGQLAARRLRRVAAGQCAGAARRGADAQGHGAAHACLPGPSIKLPPLEALPLGARLVIARIEDRMAVTQSGAYVPARAPCAARLE